MESAQVAKQWQALVWPHLAAVLRIARILSGNAADAEDLAQETMLKSYKAFASFRQGSDVKAWVMTILRNTWRDRVRTASSHQKVLGLENDVAELEATAESETLDWEKLSDDPEQILNQFSDQQIIEAMGLLPVEVRWTLLLVDVEGIDHSEAAQVLGVPEGTIKSRAHRGRSLLRQALMPIAREMRKIRE